MIVTCVDKFLQSRYTLSISNERVTFINKSHGSFTLLSQGFLWCQQVWLLLQYVAVQRIARSKGKNKKHFIACHYFVSRLKTVCSISFLTFSSLSTCPKVLDNSFTLRNGLINNKLGLMSTHDLLLLICNYSLKKKTRNHVIAF